MAKTTFAKLNLTKQNKVEEIQINELPVRIKQYLTFEEKTNFMSKVVNLSIDDGGFYNPCKVQFYFLLELVFTYTDISFTDKQKEDLFKIYDLLEENGVFDKIISKIPYSERRFLIEGIKETIESIYSYKNSIMGILEAVSTDYKDLELDANKISTELSNPENLKLLKDVVTKLG